MIPQAFSSRSIAAILPRYGKSLGGGAETLVRDLLLHACDAGLIERAEVWTTCALDHRSWANALPPGVELDGPVLVRRFPVDERDLEVFIRNEMTIHQRVELHVEQQLAWMSESVNSRAMYSHIERYGAGFDALLVAPYLFATSFWGALIHPERTIIIPCLHDEAYAYLPIIRAVFQRVRGCIFNAEPEAELAQRIFGLEDLVGRSAVVGMGFEPPRGGVESAVRKNPYLLYSGRKETGKNLDHLFDCYAHYRRECRGAPLDLVVIGSGTIDFCAALPEGVADLGFVTEEEKLGLMQGAFALCQPSVNESFSIVLMESWQMGTPVLVNARCPVTRHHAVRSGGGLYFDGPEEFSRVVQTLERDPRLLRRLGEGGKHYVATEYSWDAVLERFAAALDKICATTAPIGQVSQQEKISARS